MSDEQNESTDNGYDEDRDTSGLPKWARNSLSKANNEAAKFRNELRQKTEEHTATLAQIDSLSNDKSTAETERDSAQHELRKLQTVLEAGVPGGQAVSIAARLQGSTDEELKADASKLVDQFGLNKPNQRAVDPSQARGNDNAPKPSTPQEEFAQLLGSTLPQFRK